MNVTGLKKCEDLSAFMAHLKNTVFTLSDLIVKSQDEINREIYREFLRFSNDRSVDPN